MPRQKLTPAPPPVDFTVEYYGSVFLVQCHSDAAKAALLQFAERDAQWLGPALAVEPRFIGGLVSSLRESGWRVE